jgi:DNA invertase Pin-like site-specific DNA recombinase
VSRRAVALIRVSTHKQAVEGASLEAQDERVRAYCQMAGLELIAVLPEEGVSAGKPLARRSVGQALLRLIEQRHVEHVVAFKLDRLFRDACDCLNHTRAWERQGVALHLVDLGGQAIDTRSAMGRMFLTMAAGFAELERNLIAERTRLVLEHKRRLGARLGGAPTGWRKVRGRDGKQTVLAVDPAGQALLTRLRTLRDEGLSLARVVARLIRDGVPTPRGGRWNIGTVSKMLRRAQACREEVHRDVGVDENHPALYPDSISAIISPTSAVGNECRAAERIARSFRSASPPGC